MKHGWSLGLALCLNLLACQPNNPPITGPVRPGLPAVPHPADESVTDGLEISVDHRVDILLVIDDSRSMEAHHESLSKNINAFIDGLGKAAEIDFHLGYTFIHDSSRYGTVVPKMCGDQLNWSDPGSLGALHWQKNPNKLPKDRRFVTKDDDYVSILRDTLDPNINHDIIKPLVDKTSDHPDVCPRGADREESFTPLLAALENTKLSASPDINQSPNHGFRRDGVLFTAILISDAKDESRLTPEEALLRLKRATGENLPGGKRSRVFAVGIKPGTYIGPGTDSWNRLCKPDPAWGDNREAIGINSTTHTTDYGIVFSKPQLVLEGQNPLATLAELTEGDDDSSPLNAKSKSAPVDQVLDICSSDYGTQLAQFSSLIKQDVLQNITIPMAKLVEQTNDPKKELQVSLGDKVLTQGDEDKGGQWNFNVANNSIEVYAHNIDWSQRPGAKIRVRKTLLTDPLKFGKPAWGKH